MGYAVEDEYTYDSWVTLVQVLHLSHTHTHHVLHIPRIAKRDIQNRLYSAKETYNLIGPTNRSHSISAKSAYTHTCVCIFVATVRRID